jgi:hypothetical protein
MDADAEMQALQGECESTAAQLEELEAKVKEWRAPLAKTMADLRDTQAAHAYVQTLHQLGELTREYDALPPAPGAETAAKVAIVEQLAALASTAGAKRGGSAAVVSVLEALNVRGGRLRGSLEAALASSLNEGNWPKEPLQPPGESSWFQPFTDLTKLQVAAWRHRSQVERNLTHQSTSPALASFVHGSRSVLWAMAVLCQPLLRRFQYHFCGSRETNRLDKPEWMFAFVEKLIVEHEPSLAHLQAALDAGGVGYGVCTAGSELLRPVLQALRMQLRTHVSAVENELSGAAGRARLQQTIGSSVAAGSRGVASLAGAALAGLSQVRSEVQAGHGKDLLASGLSTISKVARPMASHQNGGTRPTTDDTDGGSAGVDVPVPPQIEDAGEQPTVSPEDETEDAGYAPTDYLVIFAHYINETLIFEKSLAKALELNVSLEEHDLAAAQSGRDSVDGDDDDDENHEDSEGKEAHVGRPVVGLCLSCVLAAGAPSAGPGRRWLEMEASQAEKTLQRLIADTPDLGDQSSLNAEAGGNSVGRGSGIERMSDLGDGSGKPCLAVVCGLLEVLDQVVERLRLLPSTALRKAFVEHVHVPLLADYSGRIKDVGRSWRRGRRDASTAARAAHYALGCAIHNSASYVASSLRGWGETMFFLALQQTEQTQFEASQRGSLEMPSPVSVRGSTAGPPVTFFETDRPGSVEEWRSCAKGMVAALVDSMMDEISVPLQLYVDAAAAQGLFWLSPPAATDSQSEQSQHEVTAVSEELLVVLADLGAMLQQCKDQLVDNAWSALRRHVARQLDEYLFERLLCEMHCTRTGLKQLEQDFSAVFGLFNGSRAARPGRRREESGAGLFRRSGDTLTLLQLPASRLEQLQSVLWPGDDLAGGDSDGACLSLDGPFTYILTAPLPPLLLLIYHD